MELLKLPSTVDGKAITLVWSVFFFRLLCFFCSLLNSESISPLTFSHPLKSVHSSRSALLMHGRISGKLCQISSSESTNGLWFYSRGFRLWRFPFELHSDSPHRATSGSGKREGSGFMVHYKDEWCWVHPGWPLTLRMWGLLFRLFTSSDRCVHLWQGAMATSPTWGSDVQDIK